MRYEIRPYRPDDLDLVVDSWLNSWRTNRYAGVIPNHLYYSTQRTLIEDLIARGARIMVADAGKTILAWACAEEKDGQTVLHYVHTKDIYIDLAREVEAALIQSLPGKKPGRITHHLPRYVEAGWWHTPEMARRKSL
jgi:hypothetical protein